MHGKILIIDAIATNRIVLKVKLSSAYYDVEQACSISEAETLIAQNRPDVILANVPLPDGCVIELTRRLRRSHMTRDIPVVAIESSDTLEARLRLLAAGIDDVLVKPINDTLLFARVRSLVRAHTSTAEWRMRDDTSRALGFQEQQLTFTEQNQTVFVAKNLPKAQRWVSHLRQISKGALTLATTTDALIPGVVQTPQGKVEKHPDVFVLVFDDPDPTDMLRLLASIRAHNSTRHCGVLVLQLTPDESLGAQAFDLGADDLMTQGFNAEEMTHRIHTLVRRKRIGEQLRATVRTGLEAALCDPLTGLHNRRYAMPHLNRISDHSAQTGKHFAVMIADMDHFKHINDVYGHAAGDAVLIETAQRLRENLRAVDLIARIGGEEFLIVMPGVSLADARNSAKRLCHLISDTPFALPNSQRPISATVSIGLAIGGSLTDRSEPKETEAHRLLDRADKALYDAKMRGRNQVTLSRPAA